MKPGFLSHCGWWTCLVALILAAPRAQSAGLSREFYAGIPGESVSALTSAPSFPDSPTFRDVLTVAFETGPGESDNYGQRIRAYLQPPETGDYVFWIASDDHSVLQLGMDEFPDRKRVIAAVTGATGFRNFFAQPGQQSAPVRLEGGRLYYIEALMKEGGGDDHLSVRWQLPSGLVEEPIPATYFLPYGTALFPPQITRQPASVTVTEGEPAVFRVEVRNADPLTYQWQRGTSPIPGATGPVLVIPRVGLEDSGALFRVTLTNPLGVEVSEGAVLNVRPDRTPPGVEVAYNISLTNVVIRFTEALGTNSARMPEHYSLSHGARVTGAELAAGAREVILTTTELTPDVLYTVTVGPVTDQAATPNPVPAGTRISFTALTLAPAVVGGGIGPGDVWPAPGGLDIRAAGLGLGGTNDQAHFSHQQRTGDFDVRVRLEALPLVDLFAHAGIMARRSLRGDSPFAAAIATPSHAGSHFQWRQSTGAVAIARGHHPASIPNAWLRLRRTGTNFSGYASHDGRTWTLLGTAGIDVPETVFLGLTLGGGSTNTEMQVAFRDFSDVTEVAPPPPPRVPEVEPLGPSSRRTALVISEISYHPPDNESGRELEFVELFNADSVFVEIGGYRLGGDIQYVFPRGTRIPAGGFLVVAQSPGDITAEYGLQSVHGPWMGRLPRGTGTVELRNRRGALLLQVEYSDESPWPASADGAGHTLVLARPSYGEGDERAWAASQFRGGSPGRPEPPPSSTRIVLNEILARTDAPALDFVEIRNLGHADADVSGYILTDDPWEAKFRIPQGTVLRPGGIAAWDETDLGFALAAEGEEIYLIEPDGSRVADSLRFGPQLRGISLGRGAVAAEGWHHLSHPTPGAANAGAWRSPVIFNEIMYNPPGGETQEWVELHNRGAEPVNLRDWRVLGGISYVFTSDTLLEPGGFIVVAADAAALRASHPDLDPARVVGDFSGSLRNSGERIALARPELIAGVDASGNPYTNRVHAVVNEVHYRDGGRWGRWSDGDGSSLELKDPRADNRFAPNWADSDESGKGDWETVEVSGLLELGEGGATELHIMLLGDGECLVDNVRVIDQSGANLVPNPTFEGGFSGWIAQGNHVASGLAATGIGSRRSMHLRASGGGDNGANRVKTTLAGGTLLENTMATIRADVRWLRGHGDLLLRLKGNYLEAVAQMSRPRNLGTPGAPNSRLEPNAGPAIVEVSHAPILPSAREPVIVTARVDDPDGVGAVRLRYRYDPSVSIHEEIMRDDGIAPDLIARDGVYTAALPGQAAGVLIAFHVEARDEATPAAVATFPADPSAQECLVRFGEEVRAGSFGTYRLWMTQANLDAWSNREVMSNEALDGTIVYGTSRVIYNGGARYRGSPFIRPNYDTPTGSLAGYIWTMPSDDRLLGSDEFNLDWLEQPGRDPTFQRERMSFWIGEQIGASFSHTRYVNVYINGIRRGEIYTDSQQPNGEYVESWFPEATDGEIFKIDDWFEFNDAVAREFNVDARLEPYRNSLGLLHKTRYRWNWEKKSNRGVDDDYTPLIELVEALNLPDEAAYTERVPQVIDLDGWMRAIATRRVVGDWDGYGYDRGKNTFAYRPPGGGWHLLLWDLDFSLGGGSDGPTTGIFHANDPTMERMYAHPAFGRVYLQAIGDAVRGPLSSPVTEALLRAQHRAFAANGINAADPAPVVSWIAERRQYLAQVLVTNSAPWSIAQAGSGLVTDESVAVLNGTAPIEVRRILVNGVAYEPAWETRTNWVLRVPLRAGLHVLSLTGVDAHGDPVPGATGTVHVEFTGEEELPEDFVGFTEIMYAPPAGDLEFAEIHNRSTRTTFDMSGWRLDGADFDFPDGTSIAPGAYLLVVQSRQAFQAVYGTGLPIVGEFAGRLDNAGETLRLLRPGPAPQTYVVVDEITYGPRPPWPSAANGGGSLQVLDPSRDNRRPANWIALDAAGHGHSPWRFVSVTDRGGASELRLELSGPGEVLVDDLSLVAGMVPRSGTELIANGGFESPLETAWAPDPAYAASRIEVGGRSGTRSLRLAATQQGFEPGAALRQILAQPTSADEFHTLSFWYRAERAGAELTVRLAGTPLAITVDGRESPLAAATPGAPSSVRASLPEFPDLWINEVHPPAPGGSGRAWVELYNGGNTAVSLSGWALSSNPGAPGEWMFPSNARIGAGEFLVVWTDGGAPEQGGIAGGVALASVSGSVTLARTRAGVLEVVDYLHYEGLASGRSAGSYPDGAWSDRLVFEMPTPGAPNDVTSRPVQLSINEWMSRNNSTLADPADGDFDDWFEIYNAGSEPVDLSGYSLTDDPREPRKFVVPPGYVVPARGMLLVWADGEPEQNTPGSGDLHANFSLSFDGEYIGLYSPSGLIIDLVAFGPQDRDVSDGLIPDGAVGSVFRLPRPSPRAPNDPSFSPGVRFSRISVLGGAVTLTWEAVPGRTYQLQAAEALTGPWIDIGAPIVAAGETATGIDAGGIAAARFYRVVSP